MPITSTVRRSEAAAISSAWSMAYGVSTIAQSLVCSGAPVGHHRLHEGEHGVGAVDLGYDDRVRPGGARGGHVVGVPLGVGAVDADRELAAAVRRRWRAAAHAASRAASLASGATASSRSRISPSQGRVLAFSSARSLELGM